MIRLYSVKGFEMINRNLLSVNQNAILSTMKATGGLLKVVLFNKPETNDVDERVVVMIVNNGDIVEDILEHFYTKHNLCLDITGNIDILETMIEGMYKTVNDLIDTANEEYKFEDAIEVLYHAEKAPDEEFAKYFIMVKDMMESIGIHFSRLPKSKEIFLLSYWMEVFAENFVSLNKDEFVLCEEKYW